MNNHELFHRINVMFQTSQFDDSYHLGMELIEKFPEEYELYRITGISAIQMCNYEKGYALLEHYHQKYPNDADICFRLAKLSEGFGHIEAAIVFYQKSLTIRSTFVVFFHLAKLYSERGDVIHALKYYKEAYQMNPKNVSLLINISNTLLFLGKTKQAQKTIQKALQIEPKNPIIHYNLSNIKKYRSLDTHMKDMLCILEQENCSTEQKALLHFALGKAYSDLSMFQKSIHHIKLANTLWNSKFQFDIEEQKCHFQKCQNMYSDHLLPSPQTLSKKPIFIVGMPRCGSTLIEQILSCHSKVHAMGETDLFSRTVHTALQKTDNSTCKDAFWDFVRKEYIQKVQLLRIDEEYMTDKMLFNFVWIGVIFSLFPDAKIVHVQREPMATCWSIYKHLFTNTSIQFAYSQENIASYYNLYVDVMNYWEKKYPNRILHVNYEQLTEKQELVTKQILQYLELEWEEDCLNFHEQKSYIQTTSSQQVRKKIYRDSSSKWKLFQDHLQPMVNKLKA